MNKEAEENQQKHQDMFAVGVKLVRVIETPVDYRPIDAYRYTIYP